MVSNYTKYSPFKWDANLVYTYIYNIYYSVIFGVA